MRAGRRTLDRLNAWSPVLLLGALAALTWWLDAQIAKDSARRDGTTRHDPDLFIENFRAESYDATGRLRQRLAAANAQHHPDDQSIDLTRPRLALTDPGKPKLTIEAESGTIDGDHETVVVRGAVRAVREAEPAPGGRGEGPITITTEELRVASRRGLASSDRLVTIEDARGIIRSVGMELDTGTRTIKLHSRVSGTFAPPQRAK